MEINGKTLDIYQAKTPGAPLVLLNSYMRSRGDVFQKCGELGCPDFSLAEVSGLNWDDDMSPWVFPPYGGRADDYLRELTEAVIPTAKAALGTEPQRMLLAGYSLAGLFALYAATKCDLFEAVASCSGSLWYPDFRAYITACDAAGLPKAVWLSLGDREARTRHPLLRTVEDNTRAIAAVLSERGVRTAFEMNKGNHFQQATLRTAKGIKWILEQTA